MDISLEPQGRRSILSGSNHYRRMQNYYVKGHRPDDLDHGGFMGGWGFCPIALSQAFMAKQSSQSDLAIGILWGHPAP